MSSNAEIKQKSSFKSLVPPPPTRVSCGSGSSTGGSLSSAAGLTEDLGNVSMESDHARSVSFSSDKFPPSPLVLARIQHGEKTLPFSPGGFPLPPPTTSGGLHLQVNTHQDQPSSDQQSWQKEINWR